MKGEILVTDSLFIGSLHEEQLRNAGYRIARLDVPRASEKELIHAIQGKIGYILGGIEHVSSAVIAAATDLKAIAFTGSGYKEFIPAYQEATSRGIAITNALGGNANSVAEYTLALILALVRNMPLLTSKGGAKFHIAREFSSLTIGVIGYGQIGKIIAKKAKLLGFDVIIAADESNPELTAEVGCLRPLGEVVSEADVLTLHVSKGRGDNVLSEYFVTRIKPGACVVNAAFPQAVDQTALLERVRRKEIAAAFDAPPEIEYNDIPCGYFLSSNAQTAFNTVEANERISSMAVKSLLNVLEGRDDDFIVNPEFLQFRLTQ